MAAPIRSCSDTRAVTSSSSPVTPSEFADDCSDGTVSCTTCMFVMERLRVSPDVLPASVCAEMMMRFPDAYPCCTRVVHDVDEAGAAVRKALFDGCYQVEIYGGAKEWIRPCPPHVVCNQILTGRGDGFCPVEPADRPFGK